MLPPPEAGSPLPIRAERLGWMLRIVLLTVGTVLITLLATAASLSPDKNGLGTHHQLGLPACSLRQLARIRCPSCGMTTSWAHMMRGHVLQSFACNSGGALLAIASAVGGPWLLLSGLRGRWLGGMPNEWWFAGMSVIVLVVTLTDWGVRLYVEHGK